MIIGISGKQQSGKDYAASIIRKQQKDWKIIKFADKVKDIVCLLIGCSRADLEDIDFKNKELGEEWRIWKILEILDNDPQIFASEDEVRVYLSQYGESGQPYHTELLTPRKLLQLVGTEAGRNIIHPNLWVNATMSTHYKSTTVDSRTCSGCFYISSYEDCPYDCSRFISGSIKEVLPKLIITDLRFPNEAQAIKDRGGITIRLERPISQRWPELSKKYAEYSISIDEASNFADSHGVTLQKKNFMVWLKDFDNIKWQAITHVSETSLDDYKEFDYVIKNDSTEELIESITKILETINK